MCGIAGFVAWDGRPADLGVIREMTGRLRHRGPDGEGLHLDGPVALGHRRLAIIDPEGGTQPFPSPDGTAWITFNGEIYNYRELADELRRSGHRFTTHSDTEVLIHAWDSWGERMVERLRGMFAFAIWDSRRRLLFVARDRLGIKPLYYVKTPELFAFASELEALHALPGFRPDLDLGALDLYLQLQYVPAPLSIYRQVRKLPPAHTLTLTATDPEAGPKRYWELAFRPRRDVSEAEWLERLDGALAETIRAHLVSDVRFGAFLSGGVDSSTVVAYMTRVLERPVQTFAIGFEDPLYDESGHAREAARRLGTEHHQLIVRPDALGLLPDLVRHIGEPLGDSSALPTYHVAKLAAGSVKMVLSGDGGDETFAGYASYQGLLAEHRPPRGVLRKFRHGLGHGARSLGLRPALARPEETWWRNLALVPESDRRRLYRPEYAALPDASRAWYEASLAGLPSRDLLSRFQAWDLAHYLSSDILAKVDVASMCHGLEVRVPLLDHRLVELVAEIPSSWKLRRDGGQLIGKYLLKKNGERFFEKGFLNRRKQGFEVPLHAWLGVPEDGALEARLLEPGAGLVDFFEPAALRGIVGERGRGRRETARLWSLLVLGEWWRQRGPGRSRAAA